MNGFRKHLFPLLFLVLGVALIYSNSLDGSFHFDDLQIKVRPNLHITNLDVRSLKATLYWTPLQKRIYRPLPCLTLGLNYYFGNENPFGYHVVNITIHILCSIAVYVFLHTLLSVPGIRPAFAAKHRHEIAVIATYLFAFHPIQTNVATYIIQRMTSIAALFYILSFTGYITFRIQTLRDRKGSTFRKYLGLSIAIISGFFSFLSKENSAVLPVMILATDYLFFYSLFDEPEKQKLRRIYAVSIFFLLVLLAYAGPKFYFSFLHGYKHRGFSFTERMLTEPRIIFFYLYLLLVPNINLLNLNHDVVISKNIISPPQTIISILVLVFLVFAAYRTKHKYNLLAFVILWYLGNLAIESSVIPLELIFEHRTYLPGVLIFFLISLTIVYICRRLVKHNRLILLTSLLLILYGNGTYLRNFVFRTPLILWSDVAQKSPNLARAHGNLGRHYMENGYHQEAREALEKAVELDPNLVEAMVNLGKLYLRAFGMKEEAMALLKRAQVLTPDSVFGAMSLGIAYLELKDYEKAEHYFGVAVRIGSSYFLPAINGLGVAKIYLGKKDEAIDMFKYGIRLDPTYEDLYINLSKLHYNEKRPLEAVRVLEEYLSINKHPKTAKFLLRVIRRKMELAGLASTRPEVLE